MPWITKNKSKSGNFFSNFLVSVLMISGHKMSSPEFLSKEKDKTLVALSLFLYFLFKLLDIFLSTKAMDSSYLFFRISFLISKKGKLGSLLLVLFTIEKFSSTFECYLILPNFRSLSFSFLLANLFRVPFFILSFDSFLSL